MIKNYAITIMGGLTIISLILGGYPISKASAAPEKSPEASQEADIDPDMIKENIKRRIEQAAKNQANTDSRKKIAYIGTLSSVTTHSFSLETINGEIRQASTSAATTVIELPKNKDTKFEDISIGDYIAALGYVNESTKVLDTRRILTLKIPPTTESKKSYYGIVTKMDPKKSALTVLNPRNNQETIFYYTKKTLVNQITGSLKQKIDPKSLPLNAPILIVYSVDEDDNVASTILVKSPTISSPTPSPTASASASPKPKKVN